jgi:hypothetical protein
MMSTTQNLKKHITDLEKKRFSAFFQMQKIALDLNGRLYGYNAHIGIGALAVLLFSTFMQESDAILIMWSKVFAISSIVIAFVHYLYILDAHTIKIYKDTRMMYATYDDEYTVLKKFNSGEINEKLIRQYYIEKTKKIDRYEYPIMTPGWITWITTSLFLSSVILFALS